MVRVQPQYITDFSGKKISVVLSIEEFQAIIKELEMTADVRLFDEVKASNEVSIPIDEAFEMIEVERKNQQ